MAEMFALRKNKKKKDGLPLREGAAHALLAGYFSSSLFS
jgi:hypothetical protein